jgi:hypothetical protein
LNEYQNEFSKQFCGNVLIPDSILYAMNGLIAKIKPSISKITTNLDKSLAENNSLKLDLYNSSKRELKYKKESEFLRNWNKELIEERKKLKEEIDDKEWDLIECELKKAEIFVVLVLIIIDLILIQLLKILFY